MSNPFDGLRDAVTAEVDLVFAETLRISFIKDGRSDPDRPDVEISAVLRTHDQESRSFSGGASRDFQSEHASGGAVLRIDRAKFPDLSFRKRDIVQALDRPGAPKFSVLSVDSRNDVRLIVELGEA